MSEYTVELGVVDASNEGAFVCAIDRFARWREATSGQGWMERDAPDLMVKTVCAVDGRLKKAITFQDEAWARTFMQFWKMELSETA